MVNKGTISAGKDADLVVIDPFTCTSNLIDDSIRESHVLKDQNLLGSVQMTFLRGRLVFRRDLK